MLHHNLETIEVMSFGCLSDLIGGPLDQILIDDTTDMRNEVMFIVIQLGCSSCGYPLRGPFPWQSRKSFCLLVHLPYLLVHEYVCLRYIQ